MFKWECQGETYHFQYRHKYRHPYKQEAKLLAPSRQKLNMFFFLFCFFLSALSYVRHNSVAG